MAVTRRLRDSRAEAQAATAEKTRFIAAASHDLRQPLHALGLFVETLQDRAGEADDRLVDLIRKHDRWVDPA